jgi:hypothetical protein
VWNVKQCELAEKMECDQAEPETMKRIDLGKINVLFGI